HPLVRILQAAQEPAVPGGDHGPRGGHRTGPGGRGVRGEGQRWERDRSHGGFRGRNGHDQPVSRSGEAETGRAVVAGPRTVGGALPRAPTTVRSTGSCCSTTPPAGDDKGRPRTA